MDPDTLKMKLEVFFGYWVVLLEIGWTFYGNWVVFSKYFEDDCTESAASKSIFTA